MQHMYTSSDNRQTKTRHDMPIAILPFLDKPPSFQKSGQSGKEGTPHKPLLPERLQQVNKNINKTEE